MNLTNKNFRWFAQIRGWINYCIAAVILLLLSCKITYAQNQGFSFIKVNEQSDLPDNTIEYIFQDNKKFIWLCTGKGLVKYDGNNFVPFVLPKNNSMVDLKRVTHIMQDDENRFWISTSNNGVILFNPENDEWQSFKENPLADSTLNNNNIHNCYQDSKGRIWVCSLGTGIYLWLPKEQKFKNYQHTNNKNSLPNNHVSSIIEDSSGNLWIACEGEYISHFNPDNDIFTNYKTHFKGMNMGAYYKQLFFTAPHALWITTDGTGIYKLNTRTFEFTRYYQDYSPKSLNNNYVKGMIADIKGNMLFITDGGGINILDTLSQQFSSITYNRNENNGLTTNALYSIFKDADENIWLGTFKSGLFLLKKNTRTFRIITEGDKKTGLSHKSVLSILKDGEGIFWYGTDGGGLNSYNPVTSTYNYYKFNPNNKNSISDNVIKDIHEDREGILWLATFFGGLNSFDKKTQKFTQYKLSDNSNNHSISSNNSWCLMEDQNENIWIGNFSSGLDIFNKKTKTFTHLANNYGDTTSLSHAQVSSMVQDSAGNIWIGTLNGLNVMNYDTKKCRRFFNSPNDTTSLNDNFITCLLYSSENKLWIGTETGGLNLMIKPGIFKSYGESDELQNYSIQSIEEDNSGNLWISTNNGLFKFDPELEVFFNMANAEDLIGNEYNWNSSYIDEAGNLYFGSINGACIFNPANIQINKTFPKIEFTNFKIFDKTLEAGKKYHGRVLLNKSITYGGDVTLSSKENAFTIDFSAIEYDKPHKIKYKYKLEGFDNDFRITDSKNRNTSYTNLPGGKYVFLLTSTNSNGVWNSEYKKLNINILPPFYKTIWFKLIALLVLIVFARQLYKRNVEKHRQIIREEGLKREKELAQQRNSELKNEIASNTILLLQKNESLEMIKNKLNEVDSNDSNKQKVQELIDVIEHQKDVDTYWKQFQFNFDNAYNNLLTRLKEDFPELTKTNLKLCAYLRLNLSTKEIASIMNVTISGIDKARNRLRKKLNIQPNDDLFDFLINY